VVRRQALGLDCDLRRELARGTNDKRADVLTREAAPCLALERFVGRESRVAYRGLAVRIDRAKTRLDGGNEECECFASAGLGLDKEVAGRGWVRRRAVGVGVGRRGVGCGQFADERKDGSLDG
jgi:hypothetical protein